LPPAHHIAATTPGGIRAATSNLHLTSAAGTPTTRLTPAADEAFDLAKGNERSADGAVAASDVLPQTTQARELDGEQQISAADYNPNEDRKHDHERLQRLHALQQASSTIQPSQTEIADGLGEPGPDIVNVDADESEYEEVEVDDDDEDFDMFSMDEPKKKKTIRRKKEVGSRPYVGANRLTVD
jgi:serine/threonine-protein kinase PRP4